MFNKIAEKVAAFCGENSDFGVNLNASSAQKKAEVFLKWESLSDLLPYRSYDTEYGLFISERSIGFVLELGLFMGSEEKLENDLSGLFKSILPGGASAQFLLSAMPYVDHIIDGWGSSQSRKKDDSVSASGMLDMIEEKRSAYFRKMSEEGKSKFRIRDFRAIVSVSMPVKERSRIEKGKIADLKLQVKALFESRGSQTREFKPEDLINYVSDILNYDGSTKRSDKEWNKLDAINDQIIDRCRQYTIKDDGIGIDGGDYEMKFLSVARYPGSWTFDQMNLLLGDSENDYLKIPCPFLIHFGIEIESSKFKKTGMLAKASRVESQAASPLGNWIPALKREAEEWGFVREQLEKNERLVKTCYQVILIDKPKRITTSEQITLGLYRSHGRELSRDRFIVVPLLLGTMPLAWAEGMASDMKSLKKLKTTLSYEPVNLMPIQGEFKGTQTPGMLLTGRRGQLFYWYPFDTGFGNANYNVAVVGGSGKGKSVFMQNLAESILRNDGRIYVLDIGRSFEKQVKEFKGQFLEFTTGSSLCINPFSTINDRSKEAIEDALAILKPIIAMMAAPKAGTTDYEDALIAKALTEVWQAKGKEAGIGDIAEWFLERERSKEIKTELGVMLFLYTKKGAYGRYFNGEGNLDFNSRFFVAELVELKSRPDLQKVVVQILMLLVTNQVLLGDRKTASGLIFDEAWDLLQGKQGGEFIENLARTLRKYKGALITGTQNLDDFYSSSGAKAAFMNTDWLCCLAQKNESIALLKEAKKFKINASQQRMLESVDTKPGEYAEVMIMANNTGSVARLILDPFSRVLYSTTPEEVEAVRALQERGVSQKDAIEQVARERYGDE